MPLALTGALSIRCAPALFDQPGWTTFGGGVEAARTRIDCSGSLPLHAYRNPAPLLVNARLAANATRASASHCWPATPAERRLRVAPLCALFPLSLKSYLELKNIPALDDAAVWSDEGAGWLLEGGTIEALKEWTTASRPQRRPC
jgi:hypothetical protein